MKIKTILTKLTNTKTKPWIRLLVGSCILLSSSTVTIICLGAAAAVYCFVQAELELKQKRTLFSKEAAWFLLFVLALCSTLALAMVPKFLFVVKICIFSAMLGSTIIKALDAHKINSESISTKFATCRTATSACISSASFAVCSAVCSAVRRVIPRLPSRKPQTNHKNSTL